jgi:hypothetical protein
VERETGFELVFADCHKSGATARKGGQSRFFRTEGSLASLKHKPLAQTVAYRYLTGRAENYSILAELQVGQNPLPAWFDSIENEVFCRSLELD